MYKYPIYAGKDRFHPTQKSLPMFEELIRKHSNEGDLVLDCFLGSGTTAVAALNTDRKFVGCELSEEYYIKSLERLQHYKEKKNEYTNATSNVFFEEQRVDNAESVL